MILCGIVSVADAIDVSLAEAFQQDLRRFAAMVQIILSRGLHHAVFRLRSELASEILSWHVGQAFDLKLGGVPAFLAFLTEGERRRLCAKIHNLRYATTLAGELTRFAKYGIRIDTWETRAVLLSTRKGVRSSRAIVTDSN